MAQKFTINIGDSKMKTLDERDLIEAWEEAYLLFDGYRDIYNCLCLCCEYTRGMDEYIKELKGEIDD